MSVEQPSTNQKSTRRQSVLLGLLSGLTVALSIGVIVAVYSEPHIRIAVHGPGGAVFGSCIIGIVTGPIGGLLARRKNSSPFVGGAAFTGVIAVGVVGFLVITYGGGDWPG